MQFFRYCISDSCIEKFIEPYTNRFMSYRFNNTPLLKGLLICPKGEANMERMEEYVSSSEYRAYQHFISNSKCKHPTISYCPISILA